MVTTNAINLNSQGTSYYDGAGAFTGLDGSTSGKALTSNGTGVAPSFQALATGSSYGGNLSTFPNGNPADSTTYYLMNGQTLTGSTISSRTNGFYVVTKAFTLTKVYGDVQVKTTLGSAEDSTLFIRVNDTTNTNITTSLKFNASLVSFNNTGLSISLSAGDYIVFGLTTPAWVTNPIGCTISLRFSE